MIHNEVQNTHARDSDWQNKSLKEFFLEELKGVVSPKPPKFLVPLNSISYTMMMLAKIWTIVRGVQE